MKVALSVEAVSTRPTGIGRYVWELAKGIAENSQVDNLVYYRNGEILPSLESCLTEWRRRPPFRRLQNWGTKRFGLGLRGALFHGPNFFLPERAENGIVTIHDLSVFKFPETHPAERVRMFESKFEATLARASHILTDCEYIRHELADWFGLSLEKISSVYLGVGANYRPHTLTELTPMLRKYGVDQTGYLLSVATYEPRKRVIAAIEAHRHLRERQQIPPLLLVGAPGWNNEELTNRIDEATRRGDVISLGHVAEEELPLIYAGASLFLFPSIYEGFGLPPIEAMACGVPTIVSDRACLPEVTRGAAMLINPDDLEGFSAAIERGLVDDRWRAQAIEAGQQVAAGYTWKRCSEETIDVYQRIWAENGRPN